jgi:hypothetical protein
VPVGNSACDPAQGAEPLTLLRVGSPNVGEFTHLCFIGPLAKGSRQAGQCSKSG